MSKTVKLSTISQNGKLIAMMTYGEIDMTQTQLGTTQSPPDSVPASSSPTVTPSTLSLIYLVGFLLAYGAALLALVRNKKNVPIEKPQTIGSQIPCRRCQFFNNNYYLKCAVNPSIVLTQNAIECSDYCPTQKLVKK